MNLPARNKRRARPGRRRGGRDEAGNALVEFVSLALILLVPLIWIVLCVFEVQRAAFAVTAAARSAGRAYVLSPDVETGRARARATVDLVLSDQGPPGLEGTVTVTCEPDPDACLAPGSTVSVRVDSAVALPWLPDVLGVPSGSVAVSALHRVPVGQFTEAASAADGQGR